MCMRAAPPLLMKQQWPLVPGPQPALRLVTVIQVSIPVAASHTEEPPGLVSVTPVGAGALQGAWCLQGVGETGHGAGVTGTHNPRGSQFLASGKSLRCIASSDARSPQLARAPLVLGSVVTMSVCANVWRP